jgi:hypothetical protein
MIRLDVRGILQGWNRDLFSPREFLMVFGEINWMDLIQAENGNNHVFFETNCELLMLLGSKES